MEPVIIVIPAEGDSAETEIWYIKALEHYYKAKRKKVPVILKYQHDYTDAALQRGVAVSTQAQVREFIRMHQFRSAEIHAQGGLGAYVAYEFMRYYEAQDEPGFYGRKIELTNVFMIGGAPCDAMTPAAKFFHRYFVKFWYHIRRIVPFFADDPPNPLCDDVIEKIRANSTKVMREHPQLYRDQLLFIGRWQIPDDWKVKGCAVWFVPNGECLRNKMWDNTYDDARAWECWRQHGAKLTMQPEQNFSFYSMMPAKALFEVMDGVR